MLNITLKNNSAIAFVTYQPVTCTIKRQQKVSNYIQRSNRVTIGPTDVGR